MPLSTSSSDARLPDGPWLKTWLLTLALAAVFLTSAEAFWRSRGYQPTLIDDLDLWATQRSRVAPKSNQVVIIGSSRNQAGIATDVLRRELPGREVVQLSVTGGHPLAVLRDLAADESFQGVVLCDLLPQSLLPVFAEAQKGYVRHYQRSFNLARSIERALKTAVQTTLTLDSAQLKPIFTIHALATRKLPPKSFFFLQADRSRRMDFRFVDNTNRAKVLADSIRPGFRSTDWPDAREWEADIDRVAELVRSIESRGGRVVFLRHVSSGEVRAVEDEFWPRANYWDAFANRIKTVAIDAQDVPGMAGRDCPDGSHLSYEDAVPTTEALIAELRKHGVFPAK